jgi:hypothetical protein
MDVIARVPARLRNQAIFHHRDAEFAEIGVFLDQELFTLRPPRLRGEFSPAIETIRIATFLA